MPETLRDAVREALETADVVVTSGGVSVGEKDLVKATMLELGVEQVFWGVKFKPGKPLFFGARDGAGYSVSRATLSRRWSASSSSSGPALMRMMGREDKGRPRIKVHFEEGVKNNFGRMHAMRVSLEPTEKGWIARSVGAQGSGPRQLAHKGRRPRAHRPRVRGKGRGRGRGDRAAGREALAVDSSHQLDRPR